MVCLVGSADYSEHAIHLKAYHQLFSNKTVI